MQHSAHPGRHTSHAPAFRAASAIAAVAKLDKEAPLTPAGKVTAEMSGERITYFLKRGWINALIQLENQES
jgi:hypothetical protein